ncbi:hypothetical protein DFJ73DRAFT_829972 [Zopfochytrium polystomum]|nr:hypothetical protein DFJ73DRAFT_829972 [Zopfochytrium polystomum]
MSNQFSPSHEPTSGPVPHPFAAPFPMAPSQVTPAPQSQFGTFPLIAPQQPIHEAMFAPGGVEPGGQMLTATHDRERPDQRLPQSQQMIEIMSRQFNVRFDQCEQRLQRLEQSLQRLEQFNLTASELGRQWTPFAQSDHRNDWVQGLLNFLESDQAKQIMAPLASGRRRLDSVIQACRTARWTEMSRAFENDPRKFGENLLRRPEELAVTLNLPQLIGLGYATNHPSRPVFLLKGDSPKLSKDDFVVNRIFDFSPLDLTDMTELQTCWSVSDAYQRRYPKVRFFCEKLSQLQIVSGAQRLDSFKEELQRAKLTYSAFFSEVDMDDDEDVGKRKAPISRYEECLSRETKEECNKRFFFGGSELALDSTVLNPIVDKIVSLHSGFERNHYVEVPMCLAWNGKLLSYRPRPDISICRRLGRSGLTFHPLLAETKTSISADKAGGQLARLVFMACHNLKVLEASGARLEDSTVALLQIVGLRADLYMVNFADNTSSDIEFCRVMSYNLMKKRHRFGLAFHLFNLRWTFKTGDPTIDVSSLDELRREFGDSSFTSSKPHSTGSGHGSDSHSPGASYPSGSPKGSTSFGTLREHYGAISSLLHEAGLSHLVPHRCTTFDCSILFGEVDGHSVCVKVVVGERGSREASNLKVFNSASERSDPRNRVIKLLSDVDLGIINGKSARALIFPRVTPLPDAVPLDVDTAELIAFELRHCLEYLHGMGFVHHDLKPSNMGLVATAAGSKRIVLFDLGLMEFYAGDKTKALTNGGWRGTEEYLPRHVVGSDAPHNPFDLDVYALNRTLGWIAYNTIPSKTGTFPLASPTLPEGKRGEDEGHVSGIA